MQLIYSITCGDIERTFDSCINVIFITFSQVLIDSCINVIFITFSQVLTDWYQRDFSRFTGFQRVFLIF